MIWNILCHVSSIIKWGRRRCSLGSYYRQQRSCGKVRLLHLSVILFTGCLCPGSFCQAGTLSRGLCLGDLCPEWVSVHGDLCPGGSLSGRPPTTPPYSNMQVIHILLECILVCFAFTSGPCQIYLRASL